MADNIYKNFLAMAYKLALDSPDTSTQNGAVVFDVDKLEPYGYGRNMFTRGVEVTPKILERPLKYSMIEHAERNAIYNISYTHLRMPRNAAMAAVWAACADCARAIVQSGVRTLVRHAEVSDLGSDRWGESIAIADGILHSGGVRVVDWRGPVDADPILYDGKSWDPRTLTLGD